MGKKTGLLSKPKRSHLLIAFAILGLALLVPRLFTLDRFVAVDEVNWLHRSANFYSAFMQGDYAGTFVNRTPGVITTWVESAAFRLEAPSYVVTQDVQKTSYYMLELVLTDMGVDPLEILHTARILMVLFLSAVLMASFYYTTRLFGLPAALAGSLLLAFDPFITALTRMSHLDAPQAVLMLLALVSLSSYLFVKPRWPDLVVSGAASGMALLAKLPGLFIVPAAGLLLVVPLWRTFRQSGKLPPAEIGRSLKTAVIWGAALTVVFALLWPSMWAAPGETIAKVFGQAVRYTSSATQTAGLGELNQPGQEPGIEILSLKEPNYTPAFFFRYLKFFLWRSTPIVLAGLVCFGIFSYRKMPDLTAWKPRLAGFWILILVYTVGMTLPWKTSDKYFAPVFMLACLIAGLGWTLAGTALARKTGIKSASTWLLAAVLVMQFLISVDHFPYYFTYYNPLLGGGQRASETMIVGIGEGLDMAARTLDELPGSEGLRVMSWYGIGPFSYFFDGQVEPLYAANDAVWTEEFIKTLQRMDYLVIYTNQKFRGGPERLFELTAAASPAYIVELEGIEYAWIYWVKDLSLDAELDTLNHSSLGD